MNCGECKEYYKNSHEKPDCDECDQCILESIDDEW